VEKIELLGGKFVKNFVVGKTATLQELRDAGFWKIFVGSGAGLPRFMNVPGEHLLNVMSANEFLTRVNLMQAVREEYETPLPEVRGKNVIVIGGGNTAMDACRTAKRLGGNVTIVYRRTQAEMPARVEELEHALEEGIALKVLASPSEFHGDEDGFVTSATLDIMELGEPDESGRRRPVKTGRTELIPADLVIMALGNDANPIIKDSEPRLQVSKWGTIELRDQGTQETTLEGVYTGGDAARGGSTAIMAAGDGQSAAREILGAVDVPTEVIPAMVASAKAYTELGAAEARIVSKTHLSPGIEEMAVYAPVIARSAQAGQFVRVLPRPDGELIPLTLADWDEKAGTVTLVIQDVGVSSHEINAMEVGDALTGIAGPLGQPSRLHRYEAGQTVVFTAGGLGLPPVYPIMREHLRMGNHVTLIAGFRTADLMFWDGADERVGLLQAEFGEQLDVVYATNDGSFGVKGFVTTPLQDMLEANKRGEGRTVAEVIAIGPPMMMRAVSDLTKPYGVPTVASLNSIMVDATGMCGACMVPVVVDGKLVRKHACIDGPEIDAHAIDWDKFLPRFNLFRKQEQEARVKHGLASAVFTRRTAWIRGGGGTSVTPGDAARSAPNRRRARSPLEEPCLSSHRAHARPSSSPTSPSPSRASARAWAPSSCRRRSSTTRSTAPPSASPSSPSRPRSSSRARPPAGSWSAAARGSRSWWAAAPTSSGRWSSPRARRSPRSCCCSS